MTVPPSLLSDSFEKSLIEMRLAFEKRLTNVGNRLTVTPTFHRGTPDPTNLPDDILGVWLDWDDWGPDSQEPYQASIPRITWHMHIVGRGEGQDQFGTDASLVERTLCEVMNALTEFTVADVGLDGSTDYVPTPRARKTIGTISGGDRRVELIEVLAETSGPMFARCPPS